MNYQETVQYLYNSTPVFEHVGASAYKEGLTNTLLLDAHFKHPHTNFRSIHIAGTNGKGSCSHTLASILQADGYKVGLYTSPHLVDFRERIRINGEMIPEQYIIDFVEQEHKFFEQIHPSFFELTTALAFKYFAEQKVDIAIIEVGLGGRLDCTNIITPLLSIITNISFDHTQFLGNTLKDIATEKAGIIKEGIPVVIGEDVPETRIIFESVAQKMRSTIVFAQDMPQVLSTQQTADGKRVYKTKFLGTIQGELAGYYQDKNANTILTACMNLINRNIIRDTESIVKGFAHVCKTTGLMGRWQTLQNHPKVICDTGHNTGGWKYLAQQIANIQCRQKRIIFGMVDDKDIKTVMQMLPDDAIYYWCQATTKRAIPADRVAKLGEQTGLKGKTFISVSDAYKEALKDSDKEDFIFIGGSSYIVADLLASI
jgi:dihydrofolate synthase/folylpolyglutamate synthase